LARLSIHLHPALPAHMRRAMTRPGRDTLCRAPTDWRVSQPSSSKSASRSRTRSGSSSGRSS
jgi:hypothetical protein